MKYFRPGSLKELFEISENYNNQNFKLLAGGTDLMPRYEMGVKLPDVLIDLKKIDGLKGVNDNGKIIEIGALTTLQEILNSDLIRKEFTALHQSAHDFAAVQIRHRATIGGNICNASPAGDTLPALYAFNAKLKIAGKSGSKIFPIKEFITGPGKTVLCEGNILQSIILEKTENVSMFFKMGLRDSMAISVFNFAIDYRSNDNKYKYLKIACGAVAPTIVCLEKYQESIIENSSNIKNELDLIDSSISPIDDIRASARYRSKALKKSVSYFLEAILKGEHER